MCGAREHSIVELDSKRWWYFNLITATLFRNRIHSMNGVTGQCSDSPDWNGAEVNQKCFRCYRWNDDDNLLSVRSFSYLASSFFKLAARTHTHNHWPCLSIRLLARLFSFWPDSIRRRPWTMAQSTPTHNKTMKFESISATERARTESSKETKIMDYINPFLWIRYLHFYSLHFFRCSSLPHLMYATQWQPLARWWCCCCCCCRFNHSTADHSATALRE